MAATRTARTRSRKTDTPRRDVAQEITDAIIARLEAGGELPWRQPWTQSGHAFPRRFNGERYKGINVLLLGLSAAANGYASPYWMSYRQASDLGGQVRKGEKGTLVVKYGTAPDKRAEAEDRPDTAKAGGEDAERRFRFLRHYTAFNACQIDGLPAGFHPSLDADLAGGAVAPEPGDPLAALADAMIAGLGVDYLEQGERACYSPSLDRIAMPPLARFVSFETYLATKFHECAHATEVPKRLGIDYGQKRHGNQAYAKGELFAEIAASFLGAYLGFSPDHIDDHAAYVQSWLTVLRGEKGFVLKAAADAQRAVDYLLAAAERGGADLTVFDLEPERGEPTQSEALDPTHEKEIVL